MKILYMAIHEQIYVLIRELYVLLQQRLKEWIIKPHLKLLELYPDMKYQMPFQ